MLFFFSYARADSSEYLKKFYSDLTEAVRSKAGETDLRKIAFRDVRSIEPGQRWSNEITEALRACKVFVYLHTPTLFTRDGCGREFRAIKDRVACWTGSVVELPQVSCIQPIYWDGEKQLVNMPPDVARIQLTHEDYGEDYNSNGLLQICRASPKEVYWKVVDAIARRIWTAARNSPLPELRDTPTWEQVVPLFPLPLQVPSAAQVSASKPVRPPRYAHFIWIVGKRDELARTRREESLECYDPEGIAEEWRPFLPESKDPAWLIATNAACEARLGYFCERLPQDSQELQRLIEQAGDAYTPVVVVSDLWSLYLDKYRAVVKVFDRGKLDNCAVLFPWNLKDHEASRQQLELRQVLAGIFPIQFHRPETSLIFEGISDVHSFKVELSKLLTKYIADVSRNMKAARELPTACLFNAPPRLGSIST